MPRSGTKIPHHRSQRKKIVGHSERPEREGVKAPILLRPLSELRATIPRERHADAFGYLLVSKGTKKSKCECDSLG